MQFVYPRNTKELRTRYKVFVHEIKLESGLLIFVERGKLGEKRATMRTNNELNRNMTPGQGI